MTHIFCAAEHEGSCRGGITPSLPAKRGQKLRLRNEQPRARTKPLPKSHRRSPLPNRLSAPGSSSTICAFTALATLRHTFSGRFVFDQPGDDRTVGSLRREHEVNAGSTALPGDPGDQRLLELFLVVALSEN